MGRGNRGSSARSFGPLPVRVVFDASALLAIVKQELGMDVAAAKLEGAAMTTVNICEVATRLIQTGTSMPLIKQQIEAFGLEIIPVDLDLCWRAAEMRPATKAFGLSLGDRLCIALAERENVPVLTGDRQWARIGCKVRVDLLR